MMIYMICSTFLEHLYTENKVNYDFAMKKHEFGMKNECFYIYCLVHLHIDNGEHVDFSPKNDDFSIKNDDLLHDLFNFCRASIHRERRK